MAPEAETIEAQEGVVRQVITRGHVTALLQPIVSLSTGQVLGYESLARGPAGSPVFGALELLGAAERVGQLQDLDALCRLRAMEAKSRHLVRGEKIFINVEPHLFRCAAGDDRCSMSALADAFGIDHCDVVFEITEHRDIVGDMDLRRSLDACREAGFHLALDDVGVGHSGLGAIVNVHPQYIKLDGFLVRGIERDAYRVALITGLIQLARETGCKIIAERIDSPERLEILCRLGVQYGQGYFLGEPAALPQGVRPQAAQIIRHINENMSEEGEGVNDRAG